MTGLEPFKIQISHMILTKWKVCYKLKVWIKELKSENRKQYIHNEKFSLLGSRKPPFKPIWPTTS